MAEETNEGVFKTTLMGGYDKDDVQKQIKTIKDEATAEKNKLLLVLKGREKKIAELQEKIAERETEIDNLKKDINVKYKSYIDNYEMIGQLVLESKIKAKQVIDAAYAEREKIIADARVKAEEEMIVRKQELEGQIREETRKYQAIQEEISELIGQVNGVQKKFLSSFKAIHELEISKPEVADELEDTMDLSTPSWDWIESIADQVNAADEEEQPESGSDIGGADLYEFTKEEEWTGSAPAEVSEADLDEEDTKEFDDDFKRLTAEAMALEDPEESGDGAEKEVSDAVKALYEFETQVLENVPEEAAEKAAEAAQEPAGE